MVIQERNDDNRDKTTVIMEKRKKKKTSKYALIKGENNIKVEKLLK